MPSDKIVLCKPHLSRQAGTHSKGKRLSFLNCCRSAAAQRARHKALEGILSILQQLKKEKAVTLNTLLPYVYDSYLLVYGCPGSPGSLRFKVLYHNDGTLLEIDAKKNRGACCNEDTLQKHIPENQTSISNPTHKKSGFSTQALKEVKE
ncbi:MAG: hypothetical protein U9N47_06925 [Thermodesulfobacteriota bacterium]|nr:hypothetical protein [Thermodesulfobacteriota bacterium]